MVVLFNLKVWQARYGNSYILIPNPRDSEVENLSHISPCPSGFARGWTTNPGSLPPCIFQIKNKFWAESPKLIFRLGSGCRSGTHDLDINLFFGM